MSYQITKDWSIEKLVNTYPQTSRIFIRYNLPCIQCGEPVWGTIDEICTRYGVNTDAFLEDLNNTIDQ